MYDEPEESYQLIPPFIIWTFVIILTLTFATVAGVKVYQHYQLGIENDNTQIIRQSNQYVTSKQEHLVTLMADYRDLQVKIDVLSKDPSNSTTVAGMQDQERAIVREMRQTTATLQPDQIPPDIARFLAESSYR